MRHSLLFLIVSAAIVSVPNISFASAHARHTSLHGTTTLTRFTHAAWLDVNRLRVRPTNRGQLDYDWGDGSGGAFWPDTTGLANVIVFDCGPWVAGKVGGIPHMGFTAWTSTYSPGPVVGGQAAIVVAPFDSLRYRVYKINRGDSPSSNPDYKDWPADLGAPVDAQGKPRLYGDQMLWSVYNNLDTTAPTGYWKTHMPLPGLPVEIQETLYAQAGDDSASLMANVAFYEWTIINTGEAAIESAYVSLWADIDFNDVTGNRPAVDTAAQLGYCWAAPYLPYVPERAVGFVWLYGPTVPSTGGSAVFRGRTVTNARNLPLTSFWGILDDSYPDSSFKGPAWSMGTAWNIARGFDKTGQPIIDSVTHKVTRFPYSGDPVTGTGWLCAQASGGAGFNMFSGPFTLAAHDTQWFMAALIPVSNPDSLQCVAFLRERAAALRGLSYDRLTDVSAPVAGSEVPTATVLTQNYPNPFNPSTTIRYGLPHLTHVTLTLFNTLGQKVAQLVDSDINAGYHDVQFNGSNLASGVYFCRLQAGDFVQTKKFMLLR